MSGITTRAALRLAPLAGDVYTATVGTSSTTAVDIFDEFSINERQGSRMRTFVTVEADAELFIVFGGSDVGAATTSSKRIAADSPTAFVVEEGRHWFRAIATAAGTRLEITKG